MDESLMDNVEEDNIRSYHGRDPAPSSQPPPAARSRQGARKNSSAGMTAILEEAATVGSATRSRNSQTTARSGEDRALSIEEQVSSLSAQGDPVPHDGITTHSRNGCYCLPTFTTINFGLPNDASQGATNGEARTPAAETDATVEVHKGTSSHQSQVQQQRASEMSIVKKKPPPQITVSEPIMGEAIVLLQDALASKESFVSSESFSRYKLYFSPILTWIQRVVLVTLLALALVEEPNGSLGIKVTEPVTVGIEVVCLLYLLGRFIHYYTIADKAKFQRDAKNYLFAAAFLVTVVDLIVFSAYKFKSSRYSRLLRPILFVCLPSYSQVRGGFRTIRRTLPKIMFVIMLILLVIAFFALLLLKLFQSRGVLDQAERPYMTNYWDNYFNLYVLMTTANFPDIMMPAVDEHEAFAFVFVAFLLSTTFILVSILLAVTFDKYKEHLELEVARKVHLEQKALQKCFARLQNQDGRLLKQDWVELVVRATGKRREKTMLIWGILAADHVSIDFQAFSFTVSLLNLVIRSPRLSENCFDRWIPGVYGTKFSHLLRHAVTSQYFTYLFDLVIVFNAILIGVGYNAAEIVFLVLFNLEILLKIYSYGPKAFFLVGWNQFDVLIIGLSTILSIFSSSNLGEVIIIFRLLRLLKLLRGIKVFRDIISTVFHLGPAIKTYGAMVLIIFYVYAIIGMSIFGNRIDEGHTDVPGALYNSSSEFYHDVRARNPRLVGTDFGALGYFHNNFNDIVASFVVLFELMVVNNWHVLTGGFVAVTSEYSRIFFLSFHFITVLVMVNIFVAFILEAFLIQLEFAQNKKVDPFTKHVQGYLKTHVSEKEGNRRYRLQPYLRTTAAIYKRLFGSTGDDVATTPLLQRENTSTPATADVLQHDFTGIGTFSHRLERQQGSRRLSTRDEDRVKTDSGDDGSGDDDDDEDVVVEPHFEMPTRKQEQQRRRVTLENVAETSLSLHNAHGVGQAQHHRPKRRSEPYTTAVSRQPHRWKAFHSGRFNSKRIIEHARSERRESKPSTQASILVRRRRTLPPETEPVTSAPTSGGLRFDAALRTQDAQVATDRRELAEDEREDLDGAESGDETDVVMAVSSGSGTRSRPEHRDGEVGTVFNGLRRSLSTDSLTGASNV